MSLKLDEVQRLLMHGGDIADIVDDLKNGKRQAKQKLKLFVYLHYINKPMYDALISRYYKMYLLRKPGERKNATPTIAKDRLNNILSDLMNGKNQAKERFYEYIIEETKRTGCHFEEWVFSVYGVEPPEGYYKVAQEYFPHNKKELSNKAKGFLLLGAIILILICTYIFR